MSNLRIQATERMTGQGHPTLPDTLNRFGMAEHAEDGTHEVAMLRGKLDSVYLTGNISTILSMTQAEYDLIAVPSPTTLYIIVP